MTKRSPDAAPVKPARLAYMPFWVERWLTSPSVRLMPLAARGLYMDMLAWSWQMGPIPADPARLARLIGADEREVAAHLPAVLPKWEVCDRMLTNAKLEEERARSAAVIEARAAAGRAGAAKRWRTHCDRNADAMATPLILTPPPVPSLLVRKRAARTDDQGRVLQHFEACYQEAYGERYTFRSGRDGKALKQIVEELGRGDVGACCDRIDRAFADDWWRSKVVSLKTMADHWERFPAGRPPDSSRKSNQLRFIEEVRNTL